jgi:hypothetical protein
VTGLVNLVESPAKPSIEEVTIPALKAVPREVQIVKDFGKPNKATPVLKQSRSHHGFATLLRTVHPGVAPSPGKSTPVHEDSPLGRSPLVVPKTAKTPTPPRVSSSVFSRPNSNAKPVIQAIRKATQPEDPDTKTCANCSRSFLNDLYLQHTQFCTGMAPLKKSPRGRTSSIGAISKLTRNLSVASVASTQKNWRERSNQLRACTGAGRAKNPEIIAMYHAELERIKMITNKQCSVCSRFFSGRAHSAHQIKCAKDAERLKYGVMDCTKKSILPAQVRALQRVQTRSGAAKIRSKKTTVSAVPKSAREARAAAALQAPKLPLWK